VRTTRQMSITLPTEMADAVRERVRSGQYASESEVVRDGLRALMARDQAVEAWLQGEVAAAYDAMQANPEDVIEIADVRAHLAARHKT
jgi:antitoxin ParD1/3/4